jgi:hypothetical protein
MRFLLALLALPALALDNGVTVFNASGSAQTSLPVSISRMFKRGDIPAGYACAQPYIEGVAATVWQCDKKSTWDDGSLKLALFGVVIPSIDTDAGLKVEFRPSASVASGSGLTKAATLALTWDADMRFTYNTGTADEITVTRDARTIMTALAESSCGLRKWRDGPVVTEWIVEDRCAGALDYDFGAKWDTGTSKWIAAPDAGYESIHPYFYISVFSGGAVKVRYAVENSWTRKAQNQHYRQRFRGGTALGTTVDEQTVDYVHAFGTRYAFDGWATSASVPDYFIDFNFGYLMSSGQIPPYETDVVVAGHTQVRMDGRHLDGYINATTDSLGTVNGSPEKPQYARNAPTWCRSGGRCAGLWTRQTNVGGGYEDLGIIPGFYMGWLYGASLTDATIAQRKAMWNTAFLGNALAAGTAQIHLRESRTATAYCANHCTTAELQAVSEFGHPVSIDAHPEETTESNSYWINGGNGWYSPVASVSGCTSGQPQCWPDPTTTQWSSTTDGNGIMHIPGMYFFPALLTGDHWYLEALALHAGYWSATGINYADQSWERHGRLGWYFPAPVRSSSWRLRELVHATTLMPDGWPEKEYFETLFKNNIAIFEGFIGLTTQDGANFYSADSESPYQFGLTVVRPLTVYQGNQPTSNPLKFLWPPAQATGSGGSPIPNNKWIIRTDKTWSITSPWMDAYWIATVGHASTLGFSYVNSVLKYASLPMLLSMAATPYASVGFHVPLNKPLSRKQITNVAQVSGTTYRLTIPSHGYANGEALMMCCADPAWTNGWADVERSGASGFWISNATTHTVDVAFPNSPTGEYPACCTVTEPYGLYAQNVSNSANNGPYFTSAQDMATGIHPSILNAVSAAGVGGISSFLDARHSYHKFSMLQLSSLLDQGLETFAGVDVRKLHSWARTNMFGHTIELGSFVTCGYTNRRDLQMSECSNPMTSFRERPAIRNLTVTPGQTQVHFRFTAPNGAGAKVALMIAPLGTEVFEDSRDTGDAAATCTGRDCTFVATGLTGAMQYRYRISGGAIGGTARSEGFITTAATSGTVDFAIQLAPPAGMGIADVVVEHGATGSYGTTETAASCATSCTVTLTGIPSNATRYIRYTYRTAGAATVAQGTMQQIAR